MSKHTPKKAFRQHKAGAQKRGIPFKFTYEQWAAWWEANLGPDWLNLRGHFKGQYVMARNRDKGPYAVWNVKCITCSQNHIDRKNSYHKLQASQVLEIYQMKGTQKAIAEEYGVSQRMVRMIKAKQVWLHLLV